MIASIKRWCERVLEPLHLLRGQCHHRFLFYPTGKNIFELTRLDHLLSDTHTLWTRNFCNVSAYFTLINIQIDLVLPIYLKSHLLSYLYNRYIIYIFIHQIFRILQCCAKFPNIMLIMYSLFCYTKISFKYFTIKKASYSFWLICVLNIVNVYLINA